MEHQLFVDLDGVLVDFDGGVLRVTGQLPAELSPRLMWSQLARTKNFYAELDWMKEGRRLWEALRPAGPVILTGLPLGRWAEGQKREWCRRELGAEVPVITGLSRNKADLAIQWMEERNLNDHVPVLVDDRLKLKEPWEAVGGVFVLHLSVPETLEALSGLGLLPDIP